MRNRDLVIVAVVVVLLGAGSFTLFQHHKHTAPTQFTVTFKDANQLRPGQFLVYRGTRIGEVKAVDIDDAGTVRVQIQVDYEHRNMVYQEATFQIERPTLTDISGEHQVTMSDAGSTRTPVVEGNMIKGSDGWLLDAKEKANQIGKAVSAAAESLTK